MKSIALGQKFALVEPDHDYALWLQAVKVDGSVGFRNALGGGCIDLDAIPADAVRIGLNETYTVDGVRWVCYDFDEDNGWPMFRQE